MEDKSARTYKFQKGGQTVWYHEPLGYDGSFHTYDTLTIHGNHHHYYHNIPHKIHVYLPKDYESSGLQYPVIYLNDGDNAFWEGGLVNKSLCAAQTVSELVNKNLIEPMILVAVCPVDRDFEYTHTYWMPNKHYGGLEQYSFYMKILVEFINHNYRTIGTRESTGIAGTTEGALAAFYTANLFPDLFGNVIAMSPSFWIELELVGFDKHHLTDSSLIKRLRTQLEDIEKPNPRLWIDWGLKRDGGSHNAVLEKITTERAKEMTSILLYQFRYKLHEDLFTFEDKIGGHDEDAWRFRFALALRQLFPMKQLEKSGSLSTSRGLLNGQTN